MSEDASVEELRRLLPECLLPDQVRLGARLARWLQEGAGGAASKPVWGRWLRAARASVAVRQSRGALAEQVRYPAELPIAGRREAILELLRGHQVVVIAGETGSGKTTQLPKMCLELGLGRRARIGCTQPRRIAAVAVARRMAEELGVEYGAEVGSKIRFQDRVAPVTSVKVMTDGILLAEVHRDPLLAEYEALVVDEAHERSLNVDFLLGHLRNVLERRDDLKVIITSATIDTKRFSDAFGGAPVIEVSGRMYPVEVRYRAPLVPDEDEEHEGETYLDAAVAVTHDLLGESDSGDVLLFMPGERDIREACDRLRGGSGGSVEVLPLFGRLSGAEQQAIFHPGERRRVVVATNVAETSLTVPRIRYVVDTGLARVSRYHPGTRCRRLPVEPIAQSSADQRKGRCGRVAEGVCVRLYAEEDFLERARFADPEIRRCNLADVILRLKAFQLGEVETFPFVDPPPPAAVRGGYALLEELGALDAGRQLTAIGRDLARLPVDPSMGRMLLAAREEGALPEVLVIAAGLSIQDPRERPHEKQEAAESAHRRFAHPESDFLTLLNIWSAYHDTWELLRTQSQLRKFCREHFLSFLRMREWVDLHAELVEAMEGLGGERGGVTEGDYAAIHRSLLTGLVGHVAQRRDRNAYRVAGGREVFLFPGSGLFVRPSRVAGGGKRQGSGAGEEKQRSSPAWVVAGEIVETSRPFARTAARIEPGWVERVAAHAVRREYVQPRWDRRSGRVLVTERVKLRGLLLSARTIDWSRIDPQAATELFIREALVTGDLGEGVEFVEANRQLVQKIELWQTRLQQRVVPDLEEALYGFYVGRLRAVASVSELKGWLRERRNKDLLLASATDLLGEQAEAMASGALPDEIVFEGERVPLRYAYAPGEGHDGVTYQLNVRLAEVVDPRLLEWLVPVLREERLKHLLRSLPKSLRRPLMPLDAMARLILERVDCERSGFLERVSRFLLEVRGVEVRADQWPVLALPDHLRPRYEIVDAKRGALAAGRDLPGLIGQLRGEVELSRDPAYQAAVEKWEREDLLEWSMGDLPEVIVVDQVGGFPAKAYPGLEVVGGDVNLRLFREGFEARSATSVGVPRLAEKVMRREIVWVQKDLRDLRRHHLLYATLGSLEELLESAWEHVRAWLFPSTDWPVLAEGLFADYVSRARERIPGAVSELSNRVERVLTKRQELLMCRRPFPGLVQRVEALVPRGFLSTVPWERLQHVPRYLQALLIRAERAAVNPVKDHEKQARVTPYEKALCRLQSRGDWSVDQVSGFRWLLEEFRVSVFAQELGTSEKVSVRKLDELVGRLEKGAEP